MTLGPLFYFWERGGSCICIHTRTYASILYLGTNSPPVSLALFLSSHTATHPHFPTTLSLLRKIFIIYFVTLLDNSKLLLRKQNLLPSPCLRCRAPRSTACLPSSSHCALPSKMKMTLIARVPRAAPSKVRRDLVLTEEPCFTWPFYCATRFPQNICRMREKSLGASRAVTWVQIQECHT